MYELKGIFLCKIKVVLEDIFVIFICLINLIIWYMELVVNVFIIKYLYFKREVFFYVFDDYY